MTDEIIEQFDLGYDKATDSITFPVKSINGTCIFVARRQIKTKVFNIPKGIDKPLYALYEATISTAKVVYVCEGLFDCLRFWCNGKVAVAGFGCLFSDYQVELLEQLPQRTLVFALDNDDAGRQATQRLKTRIKNILIGCAIFAAVIPLFTLVIGFAQDSLESLGEVADNYVGPTFYTTITRYQTGWLEDFIGGIIDIVTGLLNWLIDNVMALSMTPNQSTNIMQLIYSVTDNVGNVSSLKPFSANEWVLYLEGYRLLSKG